jgi:hypothetical protein
MVSKYKRKPGKRISKEHKEVEESKMETGKEGRWKNEEVEEKMRKK